MHLGPFEKVAGADLGEEIGDADEVVFAAVLLPGARRACRVGDGQADARIVLEQQTHQRRFAGARGRGDDVQMTGHGASLLEILDLLAHLFDEQLEFHRRLRHAR